MRLVGVICFRGDISECTPILIYREQRSVISPWIYKVASYPIWVFFLSFELPTFTRGFPLVITYYLGNHIEVNISRLHPYATSLKCGYLFIY